MAVEAYDLCPGGTGKAIKFCCKDLLPELQHLDRMLEGEQQLACLQHIERLEKTHPDRACLLAVKSQLLWSLERLDELRTTVTAFLRAHPANPVAMAEWAMLLALDGEGRRAVEVLQQAMAQSDQQVQSRLYTAMGVVADALLEEGQILAARALLMLQTSMHREDQHPLETIARLNVAPSVPLLVKDQRPLAVAPDAAPWKAEFQQAMEPVGRGLWLEAADRLAALAAKVPDAPCVWQNLATVRSWLADSAGAVEALRALAGLDIPLEDAVEAEVLGLLIAEAPLGDQIDVLSLIYSVSDFEKVQAALAAARQVVSAPIDPAAVAESEGPPPKGLYVLLDRPALVADQQATVESVPRVLAQALLYGRETDRPARLVLVTVPATDLDRAKALVRDLAADGLAGEPAVETHGKISASQDLMRARWFTGPLPPPQAQALADQLLRHGMLKDWPAHKLGLLGGRSAAEAAPLPEYRVRLLAAIMLLEWWAEQNTATPLGNELRRQLGLSELGPIDPAQTPVDRLPLARLARVQMAKLSDEALIELFRRAWGFRVPGAMEDAARALTERPSLAGRDEQMLAFRVLVQTEQASDRRLDALQRGRQAAESRGLSSASWDLMELPIRVERNEPEEFSRLVRHIHTDHYREPGVAQTLTNLLIQMGFLRPDGTPTAAPPPSEPAIVVPGSPTGEAGKLWTPDSQEPGGAKGKLWTPG